jgi:hypothetical protein
MTCLLKRFPLSWMQDLRHARCAPHPCGEGLGVGVAVGGLPKQFETALERDIIFC